MPNRWQGVLPPLSSHCGRIILLYTILQLHSLEEWKEAYTHVHACENAHRPGGRVCCGRPGMSCHIAVVYCCGGFVARSVEILGDTVYLLFDYLEIELTYSEFIKEKVVDRAYWTKGIKNACSWTADIGGSKPGANNPEQPNHKKM